MNLVVLDFETFSLKKISTQEYIRSPQFKVHGAGIAIGKNAPQWFNGEQLKVLLPKLVPDNAIICHNAGFDVAILNWHYGLRPKLIIDTISLSRAVIGERLRSHALASIAKFLLNDEKGGFLQEVMGVRDLSTAQEQQLASYCLHDVDLCRRIFYKLIPHLPKQELLVMDLVSRCYTEPSLLLDPVLLRQYHSEVIAKKLVALDEAGVEDVKDIRSNSKFAGFLTALGVEPPIKVSPAWLKRTPELQEATIAQKYNYAFAKTDEEFQALREHPDEKVQALVEARLENKTTIAETRAQTYLTASNYGAWPVGYLYSGAMTTHRLSGTQGNPQNLPRKGVLRRAIMAPIRHTLVVGDLAQIELRCTLALGVEFIRMSGFNEKLCEEYKALQMLANGGDLYCDFGKELYGRVITRADEEDRHIAKECVLGSGYQMGAPKLVKYLGGKGIKIDQEFAQKAISVYRNRFRGVQKVWKYLQEQFKNVVFDDTLNVQLFKCPDIWLTKEPLFGDRAVRLPSGLHVKYPGLHTKSKSEDSPYGGIAYQRATGEVGLFGGKLLQNMIECLSRDIIFPASLKVNKRYPVRMSTHDELVCVVPSKEKDEGIAFVKEVMETPLAWWPSLPLGAEVKSNDRYGNCK